MNNFFYHLTPDVVIKAVETAGFNPTGHCMALNSYENRVYDLKLDDGSHVVSKFYRPGRWTQEQILEEHTFLLELQQDEVPVCAPLTFSDGSTLKSIEGIKYAVWPRTGGRAADEMSDEQLATMGRLLARVHNRGAAGTADHRLQLTSGTYAEGPLHFLLENAFIPGHLEERYSNAVRTLAEIFDVLVQDVPYHRIHGDCHFGNLLYGSEGLFILDFDDFLNGPAVQDVWMLVPARDTEGLRQREVFLDAYRLFRDFNDSWLRLIEPLRAFRYIHYAGWIAKRWQDPAFPAAFPHFGSVSYWEEETLDLEDQVEYIQKNSHDLPYQLRPVKPDDEDEEKELTNKDFFWDLED